MHGFAENKTRIHVNNVCYVLRNVLLWKETMDWVGEKNHLCLDVKICVQFGRHGRTMTFYLKTLSD